MLFSKWWAATVCFVGKQRISIVSICLSNSYMALTVQPIINTNNLGRNFMNDYGATQSLIGLHKFFIFTKNNCSMITKEKLIQVINKMPDEFSIDELIEEFVLLRKIELGLADVESGRVFSKMEVEEKMGKWLR
jgi:hypothetical protein